MLRRRPGGGNSDNCCLNFHLGAAWWRERVGWGKEQGPQELSRFNKQAGTKKKREVLLPPLSHRAWKGTWTSSHDVLKQVPCRPGTRTAGLKKTFLPYLRLPQVFFFLIPSLPNSIDSHLSIQSLYLSPSSWVTYDRHHQHHNHPLFTLIAPSPLDLRPKKQLQLVNLSSAIDRSLFLVNSKFLGPLAFIK